MSVIGFLLCSAVLVGSVPLHHRGRVVTVSPKDNNGDVIEINPPDHLEGVRFEQDGHMNEDFRKEVFLGHHEEVDELDSVQQEKKLKEVFAKADNDSDGKLTVVEISNWINMKIKEHFNDAKQESAKLMKLLDTDKDGDVSYKEYMVGYLRSAGYPADKADKHMDDYDTLELTADVQDDMIRFKFRWQEAEEPPRDNKLNASEFLSFRHPETSNTMTKNMVKEVMNALDSNNDMVLTAAEFSHVPGEVEQPPGMNIDDTEERKYTAERTKEFNTWVDQNHNGKVTMDELLNYFNPLHESQGMNEAEKIIREVDRDHDYMVSLKEILDKRDYILGSKFVDVERTLHDEF